MRFLLLLSLLSACALSQRTQLRHELEQHRRALTAPDDVNAARPAAERYVALAEHYATRYPTDTLSARYLFVAADVARGLGDYERAIGLLERLDAYPAFPQLPEAVFFRGFVADANLRDRQRAARYYRAFLERYPAHPLATQVRQLLSLL